MDTQLFGYQLIKWYNQNKRELPWRNTNQPYNVWLSEIILQQTRVVQGLPYYERFVEKFPSVFDLANADEEQVMKLWQGLGYYSRAKNLHQTAKKVAYELGGVFPTSYEGLLKLKGIGDYTASAIASICYSAPYAVIDGNVYRVLSRVFGIEIPINSTEGINFFRKKANELLCKTDSGTYNQAIMEFGAMQCKPQLPDCQQCIFVNNCVAYATGKVDVLPIKLAKTKIKVRYFDYLVVIDNQGFTLLNKRTEKDIWQGLYEFPLIENKVQLSENEIITEVKKRFSAAVEVYLFNENAVVHKLSHQHLHTRFWVVKLGQILEQSIDIQQVTNFPVPILIANFINQFWKL